MNENENDGVSCSFSLAVAGMGVTLVYDNEWLFNRMDQHYKPFITNKNEGDPLLVAHISLDRQFTPSPPDGKEIVYCHTTRHFATPGCVGSIDSDNGRAHLRLSLRHPYTDVDYFLRAIFALLAFRAGGLLFHAAGIVRNERGFLFFGHSGSGKTTVARLSPNDLVLNDDLVMLMPDPETEGWIAHATPFWNPSQLGQPRPAHALLLAMMRLVQAQHVALEPMTQGQALAEVLSCLPFVSNNFAQSQRLIRLGETLLRAVPAYRLHFLPDGSFWNAVEQVGNNA